MKKVFETNDKRASSFLKNHLNDKYYESEIRNASGKYELFVNENIYDEVLIEIKSHKNSYGSTSNIISIFFADFVYSGIPLKTFQSTHS